MKRKKIFETIDNINPKYIDEATEYIPQAKTVSKSWIKWGSLAACFALVVALGIGIMPKQFGNQSYVVSLSNGKEMTFAHSSENGTSSLDIAIVGMRALTEEEASALFGDCNVNASVGFEENTNEFIYLEGTLDEYKIVVTRSDVSPDIIVDGKETASDIDGVNVSAGYFITKANSQGNKNAIVYASFDTNNYTVYLETSGTEDDKETLCNTLAEEILKLIETSNFDFGQIK